MNPASFRGAGVRVAACLAACLWAGCAGTAADGHAAYPAATDDTHATRQAEVQTGAQVDGQPPGQPPGQTAGQTDAQTDAQADAGAVGGEGGSEGRETASATDSGAVGDARSEGAEGDRGSGDAGAQVAAAGGAAVIEGGPSAALDEGEGGPLDGPPPLPTAADIERFRSLVAELETSQGTIVFGFLPDAAPYTVQNFVVLAGRSFYDGTIFHRIIPGFIAQGGDPDGSGHGGPGYMIKGEFSDVKHERGVVSMARKTHPDTAGSQFFICLADAPHLDGSYAAFGRVLSGFDALERIEEAGSKGGTPSEPIALTRVLIRKRTQTDTQTASHDT